MLFFYSCDNNSNKKYTINNFKIERFDKLFNQSSKEDLFYLKKDYSFLFPLQYDDQVWIDRLNDSVQKEIYAEINLVFPNLNDFKRNLNVFFTNFISFYPKYKLPRIITLNSDIQYENRVILTDSLLLIGLDNYLSPNHRFYNEIPKYLRENLDPSMIISDIAEEYAHYVIPKDNYYTFLDKIIFYGKVLYFKDIMLPFLEDRKKIGYSIQNIDWAIENEYYVWTYFVEKELIFSSENKLINRFINNSPFSKFYLSIDNKSSPMIGKFIGWQIVKSYIKNNNTSFIEMMKMNSMDIYNNSKYKPQK